MKNLIIAKRYADAYIAFAKESGVAILSAVEELKELKLLLVKHPEFLKFLESREILCAEKYSAIDQALKDFSDQTRQFLKLLLDKERIRDILDICDYARVNYCCG